MTAPGWARQLSGIDAKSVSSRAALAQAAGAAQVEAGRVQKKEPPIGGLQRRRAGKAQKRLFMSPGPIFEPETDGRGLVGRGARAVCRRLPAWRRRLQHLLLSPDAGRHHDGIGRARAGLRRDAGRRRQHRAAARRHRRHQAQRLCRHAGVPEDPAREGGRGRQGRLLDQARLVVGRGAAAVVARRAWRARHDLLQCYATAEVGTIAYESERA